MRENEALERRIRYSRLYDLYSPLLTERQRSIYEMHELEDLSLSEISDELKISRQGVSDQLQRVRDRLDELEKLLGFAEKLAEIEKSAQAILHGESSERHAAGIIELCSGRTMGNV